MVAGFKMLRPFPVSQRISVSKSPHSCACTKILSRNITTYIWNLVRYGIGRLPSEQPYAAARSTLREAALIAFVHFLNNGISIRFNFVILILCYTHDLIFFSNRNRNLLLLISEQTQRRRRNRYSLHGCDGLGILYFTLKIVACFSRSA